MADGVMAKIEGLAELRRALQQLPREIQGKVLADAVRAGAFLIRDEARNRAPSQTGLTRKAIVAYRNKVSTPQSMRYDVGVTLKMKRLGASFSGTRRQTRKLREAGFKGKMADAFYWRFNEFGTRRQPAKSFLRSAFEGRREAALDRIKTRLAEAIDKAAAKVGGR